MPLQQILTGALAVVCIVAGAIYFFMSRTISNQEKQIDSLKNHKVVMEADLVTEKANNKLLTDTIDDLNKSIEEMEVRNANTLKAYNDFIKKTDKEKYNKQTMEIIDKKKEYSDEAEIGRKALELNKKISELNYGDL